MPAQNSGWTDERVDNLVGRVLQTGVTVAAAIVFAGGVLYLARHGAEPQDYRIFKGEPAELRGLLGIEVGAAQFHGRSVIQLGLVLLILTPIARVALMGFAFVRQRHATFVVVTLIVLGVLFYSLFSGYVGG